MSCAFSATDCGRIDSRVAVESEITQVVVSDGAGACLHCDWMRVWWFNQLPAKIEDAAVAQAESASAESLSTVSVLEWEGDMSELESLRRDFAPIELKSKKLWDIEPTKQ
jgi:hypothetical protein